MPRSSKIFRRRNIPRPLLFVSSYFACSLRAIWLDTPSPYRSYFTIGWIGNCLTKASEIPPTNVSFAAHGELYIYIFRGAENRERDVENVRSEQFSIELPAFHLYLPRDVDSRENFWLVQFASCTFYTGINNYTLSIFSNFDGGIERPITEEYLVSSYNYVFFLLHRAAEKVRSDV